MKDINDYLLTSKVTVGMLNRWMAEKDDKAKQHIVDLIYHRFSNRYIKHLSEIKSGFLKMAIACLTIETLESFKKGEKDTKGKGRKMFNLFFSEETANFPGFSDISNDFYENIRCGILHQSETKNAWRILMKGKLLDIPEKTINANRFVSALNASVLTYIEDLKREDFNSTLWGYALDKLKDICENCKKQNETSLP